MAANKLDSRERGLGGPLIGSTLFLSFSHGVMPLTRKKNRILDKAPIKIFSYK